MGTVKEQIAELKASQENLRKKQEEKQSQKRWLMKKKGSSFKEDLEQVERLIKETEQSISELSININELAEKTRELEGKTKQMKTQLLKQAKDKDELQQVLGEALERKESLEIQIKEDKRRFEREIMEVIFKLKLQEVCNTMSFLQPCTM